MTYDRNELIIEIVGLEDLVSTFSEIWIDGELDPTETANWFPKLARKDYQIGLNNTGSGVDDPDQQFFENYGCGSERNEADR